MALIDSWLSAVPLYLFQSLPFTFAGLLIIYPDMLPVNIYKSAALGPWQQMNCNQARHQGSPDGQKPPDQKILLRVCKVLLTDGLFNVAFFFFREVSMRHDIKRNWILMCSWCARKTQTDARVQEFERKRRRTVTGQLGIKVDGVCCSTSYILLMRWLVLHGRSLIPTRCLFSTQLELLPPSELPLLNWASADVNMFRLVR